jgi:hypothetical protein
MVEVSFTAFATACGARVALAFIVLAVGEEK